MREGEGREREGRRQGGIYLQAWPALPWADNQLCLVETPSPLFAEVLTHLKTTSLNLVIYILEDSVSVLPDLKQEGPRNSLRFSDMGTF